jgi:hypothetical protein
VAFPLGRSLSSLFERTQCPDERKAVLHTVGHLDRYKTHELKLKDVAPARSQEKERKEGKCGCPYLAPIEQFRMGEEDEAFFEEMRKVEEARQQSDGKTVYEVGGQGAYPSVEAFVETSYGKDAEGHEMVLDRSPDYAANYPYLVISTNADFIPSHSAIYGERFTDFLRRFYFRHLVDRLNFPEQCFQNTNPECRASDVIPCDRSWIPRLEYQCGSEGKGGGDSPQPGQM